MYIYLLSQFIYMHQSSLIYNALELNGKMDQVTIIKSKSCRWHVYLIDIAEWAFWFFEVLTAVFIHVKLSIITSDEDWFTTIHDLLKSSIFDINWSFPNLYFTEQICFHVSFCL